MGRRLGILLALVGLLAAACTGAPRPESLAAKDKKSNDSTALGTTPSGVEDTSTTVAGQTPDAAASGGAARPGTKAGAPKLNAAGQSTTPGVRGTDGITPLNLFKPSEDRIGITDTKITLCGHAALIFASAFNTKPEDINVYWQALADRGGVWGRKVEATYEDDRYDPAAAVTAADACKAKNIFFLLGGIGFDQIPAVRDWAETNHMLYLHHIAVAKGGENKQYSFTPQPTVEQVGVASGEFITAHYKDKRIGIIHRNSENWQPGSDAGKAYMKAHGVNVVDDLGTEKNGSVYSAQIATLQADNVQVVWFWENALAAAEFLKQAHNQGYHPTFVVFPFQTTLDVLMEDAGKSRIDGVSTWPAYVPGGYTGAYAFPDTGYQEEIKAFDAAMDKYRPGVAHNDILWQVWLGNKGIEDLFQKCGRDCTRNRFAGLLTSYKGGISAACPADFPRGGGHRGGWNVFMTQEAFKVNNSLWSFRNTSWCKEHLG
jgi:ABC-type branched-subunit amino acid transport system substrate-binding protein